MTKSTTTEVRKAWVYKGVIVFPAGVNSSGIRWTAFNGTGVCLRAETKASMRQLITDSERERA